MSDVRASIEIDENKFEIITDVFQRVTIVTVKDESGRSLVPEQCPWVVNQIAELLRFQRARQNENR